jgi:hypothetical protein
VRGGNICFRPKYGPLHLGQTRQLVSSYQEHFSIHRSPNGMNIFTLQQLVASHLMFIHKHRYFCSRQLSLTLDLLSTASTSQLPDIYKPLDKLSSIPKYLLRNMSLLILSTDQLPFTLFRCHCKLLLNLNLLRTAKLPVITMPLWIRRLRLFPS